MARYEVTLGARFSGTVTVEAANEERAIAKVDSSRDEYWQQAVEEGAFPDEDDIEVEFANLVKEK